MYRKVCECETGGSKALFGRRSARGDRRYRLRMESERERERARENERVWKISRTEPNRLMREGERIKGEE